MVVTRIGSWRRVCAVRVFQIIYLEIMHKEPYVDLTTRKWKCSQDLQSPSMSQESRKVDKPRTRLNIRWARYMQVPLLGIE